jgi:RsiW-degrading membrane proteinase PrsW (M82 family)
MVVLAIVTTFYWLPFLFLLKELGNRPPWIAYLVIAAVLGGWIVTVSNRVITMHRKEHALMEKSCMSHASEHTALQPNFPLLLNNECSGKVAFGCAP